MVLSNFYMLIGGPRLYFCHFKTARKNGKTFRRGELTKVVDDAITRGEYSIAKIAAALNMSERTFCRRMKELTDVTPKIFISKIQMERCARLLLAHPDKSLAEIAEMCGFSEASGLSHAFHRAFGFYPTTYRENNGKRLDKSGQICN